MKVLVVDPDATRAPTLMRTLRDGGAEVTVAPSGSFALTMLEWNRHDVVLSRARIEDMEGHELCAIIKADPGTRDVRFVLIAGSDDVPASATTAAGVDLLLPPAMTGSGIVPLILRLVRADRVPAAPPPAPTIVEPQAPLAAPDPAPAAVAPPPEVGSPALPRIRPEPPGPVTGEPPKRYITAGTAAAAAPWSKETAEEFAAPVVAPPPTPGASPAGGASVPPAAEPAPMPAELSAIPGGTFQGSLEVMELADLTQAIAGGGKSGRLILALPRGGGMMLFEKGRVVHAEYLNSVGEEAFGALLAASQGEGTGRFCFLPTAAGQAPGVRRTIDKTVDRLLLSSVTALDEKG